VNKKAPKSSPVHFSGVIGVRGINPFIPVTKAMANRLKESWRKPLPVLVRINGQPEKPWRINMMPAGDGSFYLYLHEVVRKASGTKPCDTVDVELLFDRSYRSGPSHPVPRWFRVALAAAPEAKRAWTALAPSRKKEILRYFATLKSPEAKERNTKRAIDALSGCEVRFLARTWQGGK
jgi:hypothetical protein